MTGDPVAIVPAPAEGGSVAPAERPKLPKSDLERKKRFAAEVLVDDNLTLAAIRTGYSPKSARRQGHRLSTDAYVADLIQKGREERALRVQMTADDVLRELKLVVDADPRELIVHVIDCCRYCHGTDHRYQRTPSEREAAFRRWTEAKDDAAKVRHRRELGTATDPEVFDELGGVGFDPNRPPAPDCPECFGRGIPRTIAKDQRKLSRAGRRLLAGVRVTKDGTEVKMHDPLEALNLIGRANGMWRDNVDVTSGGQKLPPATINVVLVRSDRTKPVG